MAALMQKGFCGVLGVKPLQPILELPEGATVRRVILRAGQFGRVILRFENRIELWMIENCGDYWRVPQDESWCFKRYAIPK